MSELEEEIIGLMESVIKEMEWMKKNIKINPKEVADRIPCLEFDLNLLGEYFGIIRKLK